MRNCSTASKDSILEDAGANRLWTELESAQVSDILKSKFFSVSRVCNYNRKPALSSQCSVLLARSLLPAPNRGISLLYQSHQSLLSDNFSIRRVAGLCGAACLMQGSR